MSVSEMSIYTKKDIVKKKEAHLELSYILLF